MTHDDVIFFVGLPTMLINLVGIGLLAYFASIAIHNRKPDVPFYSGERQINILLRPYQLTETGLKARRNFFICVLVMASTIPFVGIAAMFAE